MTTYEDQTKQKRYTCTPAKVIWLTCHFYRLQALRLLITQKMNSEDTRNTTLYHSSYGASQAGDKMTDVLAKLPVCKSQTADLITLQIGENDSLVGMPVDHDKNYCREILKELVRNRPRPRIICFLVWNIRPWATYTPMSSVRQKEVMMQEICNEPEYSLTFCET